jgi:signal transduction histidine kinase
MIAAIRKEAKDLAKSTGVKARVAVADEVGRLAPEIETALYRVVQEALHNVAKHAQAKVVNIQMTRDESSVRLVVEDDGVGITTVVNPQRPTFGLAGMRERISALRGTLRVTSRKGQGTKLVVVVPITAQGTLLDRPRSIGVSGSRVANMPAAMAGTGTTD